MITVTNTIFQLDTAHTSYLLEAQDGLVKQLYYGARIKTHDVAPLRTKNGAGYGSQTDYKKELSPLSLDTTPLEWSPAHKGDYRLPSCEIAQKDGFAADFTYTGFEVAEHAPAAGDLPLPHDDDGCLIIYLETPTGLKLTLFYTVFEAADVIMRRVRIENGGADAVRLHKLCSMQLDLPPANYTLATFTGSWARERELTVHRLGVGTVAFGSRTGTSSSRCNPFFMLYDPAATEFSGDVWGVNLIWSGSWSAAAELSPYGFCRLQTGLSAESFDWSLAPGAAFDTPAAVLTFSSMGKNAMSQQMHRFIKQHILPPKFASATRPVLLNNWEATYFEFTEAKLLRLAKEAAALGVELFVLDDGWFGARNSDKAGLGDYNVNMKKLPGGLAGFGKKLAALGLQFGLWFEPEMVNEDSDLYRAHPDWIVAEPHSAPCIGRNQYVLDLCRSEVRDYVAQNVIRTIHSAPITYVKWDMNRNLSDDYSAALSEQGEFGVRWTLGLYDLLRRITEACPDVLFEGCASGGNRFDLGILSFMPQIWTSDDTDAYQRQRIQTGTSYGYPPCVMGAHVSASPNHQTVRQSPLEGRFDVAAFGVLGYELDLSVATNAEKKVMKAQIAWYKEHRATLQQGDFYRVKTPFEQDAAGSETVWVCVTPDKRHAVVGELTGLLVPNSAKGALRLAGLDPDLLYEITVRRELLDIRTLGSLIAQISPVRLNAYGHLVHTAAGYYMLPCEEEHYTAYGDLLMHGGLRLKQAFTGTGYNENVRPIPDFGGRLYAVDATAQQLK